MIYCLLLFIIIHYGLLLFSNSIVYYCLLMFTMAYQHLLGGGEANFCLDFDADYNSEIKIWI
jgi:hypothetical protein